MYQVLTGQEKKKHFGLIRLDPEWGKLTDAMQGYAACIFYPHF